MTTLSPGYQIGQTPIGTQGTANDAFMKALYADATRPSADTKRILMEAQKQLADFNGSRLNASSNYADNVMAGNIGPRPEGIPATKQKRWVPPSKEGIIADALPDNLAAARKAYTQDIYDRMAQNNVPIPAGAPGPSNSPVASPMKQHGDDITQDPNYHIRGGFLDFGAPGTMEYAANRDSAPQIAPLSPQQRAAVIASIQPTQAAPAPQVLNAYDDRLNPFGIGSGYEELQRPRQIR